MSRLIDVDEAIINFGFEWDDIPPTRGEFVRFLKKQPIIDAVPVVRCQECKYLGFCGDATNLEVMGFYGYCSRGERKEGADNES